MFVSDVGSFVSFIYQIAYLITGFIPLCENMPGGGASKPGDVVRAMNGKTIQVI